MIAVTFRTARMTATRARVTTAINHEAKVLICSSGERLRGR